MNLRAASILAALLLVAACGGATPSATPPPSATPTAAASAAPSVAPSATPTATPAVTDVSEPFVAIISDPAYAADATLTGTASVSGVEGTVSGNASFSGLDSVSSVVITIGGQDQSNESVAIGKDAWKRSAPGPWLATKPTEASMSKYLRSLAQTGVVDLGIEELEGVSYHHLQPTGGNALDAAAAGFDVEGAKDSAFTIDFYATDDGTPAIIAVGGSWSQAAGGQDVKIDVGVAYALSEFTGPIVPPDDVWEYHTSKAFGYKMAHPAEWTVKASKTQDVYSVDGQPYVYVVPQTIPKSMKLPGFVSAIKADYKTQFGDPIVDQPTTLGGQAAHRLVYRFTNADGMEVTVADDLTTRPKEGWEVFIATGGGDADVAFFDTFVATFEFTD